MATAYIESAKVVDARQRVAKLKKDGKMYSDVVSKATIRTPDGKSQAEELQWVDLVTAGRYKIFGAGGTPL